MRAARLLRETSLRAWTAALTMCCTWMTLPTKMTTVMARRSSKDAGQLQKAAVDGGAATVTPAPTTLHTTFSSAARPETERPNSPERVKGRKNEPNTKENEPRVGSWTEPSTMCVFLMRNTHILTGTTHFESWIGCWHNNQQGDAMQLAHFTVKVAGDCQKGIAGSDELSLNWPMSKDQREPGRAHAEPVGGYSEHVTDWVSSCMGLRVSSNMREAVLAGADMNDEGGTRVYRHVNEPLLNRTLKDWRDYWSGGNIAGDTSCGQVLSQGELARFLLHARGSAGTGTTTTASVREVVQPHEASCRRSSRTAVLWEALGRDGSKTKLLTYEEMANYTYAKGEHIEDQAHVEAVLWLGRGWTQLRRAAGSRLCGCQRLRRIDARRRSQARGLDQEFLARGLGWMASERLTSCCWIDRCCLLAGGAGPP